MNNNFDKKNNQDPIDLIEVLNLLINSKKIIIAITLICTIIAAIYAYSQKPVFVSTANLIVGHYNNKDLLDAEQISNELSFYLDGNFILDDRIGKFYIIKVTDVSKDIAINSLNVIVDYIIDSSKKIIDHKIQDDKLTLAEINSNIDLMEQELNRLISLENVPNTDFNFFKFTSELGLEVLHLKFSGDSLANKLNSSDLFAYTELYEEIKTSQKPSKRLSTILVGFIAGFVLSIIFVIIRQNWLQAQTKKNLQ